jgi:xanthine dehydrogenase YagR molybdenum-binding subunit
MSEHEMRVGFQADHKKIKVQVDERDIKPWDLDSKLSVVGGDSNRVDGAQKVTGKARYAFDMNLPGMLHGVILRSPHARARLKRLDVEPAKAMPGVKAVIAMRDAGNQLRFAGDAVAAVAATTMNAARDALEKIVAEYEVEAHVTDVLRVPGAPKLDEHGEVTDPWPERGAEKIEAALAQCKTRVSATYRAEVQTHSSLESHGLVAAWHGDELEVWASTQATFGVRQGLAGTLRIQPRNVRVHAEFVGGGFGSKFAPGDEGVAAARLAQAAQAPVKLMLSRYEEHTCAGNRPSALMQVRAGCDQDGKLKAFDYRNWGGGGFTGGGGTTVPDPIYLQGVEKRIVQRDLQTDTDGARAMRAPGRPQGYFSAEGILDELAVAAGIDPLAFRLKNDAHRIRQEEWRIGAEKFGWAQRRNPNPGRPRAGDDPRWLRGAGLSAALWGQMGSNNGRVLCRIHKDGSVEMRNGAQDIGTGMKTVLAILAAEELGIPVGRVRAVMGDTADPNGPASGGSTTTPTLAPAARLAAARAKEKLMALAAEKGGGATVPFDEACKLIGDTPIEAIGERFNNYAGYAEYVCGCQFAEVVVDAWTGLVKVTRMLAVQDCGTLLSKKLAESQVLGAMIEGVSYALHEQRILDHRAGRMLNGDFLWYKIAGPLDMPEMEVVMFPVMNGKNNVGAAGLGEAPAVAPAAAIHNAVANAIGVPVRALPITPDRVLKALARRKEK